MTRPQLLALVPELSLSTLIRIELHDGVPRVTTLAKLAAALDMTVDELIAEPTAQAS